VSGALVGAAAPAATAAAVSPQLAVPMFFFGAVAGYGLIASSARWAPHCPYCDGKKRMGQAHCSECNRRFSAR
jgi:hypothetical protein